MTATSSTAPPPKPLRIAVLEADFPLDGTAAKYGSYGGVFGSLLTKAASALGWDASQHLQVSHYDVSRNQLFPQSLDDLDAILITGSRANAFDNIPWIVQLVDYTRNVLTTQTRVRVIGVCFGHQIISRALGCEVVRSEIGWEASVCPVPLNEHGSQLFEGKKTLNIFQMHRDIVTAVPKGAVNIGATDRCSIQGLYSPGKFISVQGHPEFTDEIVTEILTSRHDLGVFTDEEYGDMMGRVENEHDGVVIAKAFLRFVVEGLE
ncbi:glutamine amidotransferas-like protein class-I [Ascodesmis nigricans]|uniref:Glutamine amidotransferas-like protein class-I n=1 Tax=Ascodesmis nigricans TaxID=341454 RepID=A0A4S2N087_9PEZI|nr:glutamine amidotransferas-like protein class-I [Ascodesmis nigricans]